MGKRISQLTELDSIAENDTLVIVDQSTGQTKKVPVNLFAALFLPTAATINYAGSSAPDGWLFAYGQAVSRSTYADLFDAIGTTYGSGDGSTTFNLPDARGRVIAGQDDMGGSSANRLTNQSGGLDGDTLGATGGSETHTLSTAQIPAHNHTVVTQDNAQPIGLRGAVDGAGNGFGRNVSTDRAVTQNAGSGGAHNNVQPTLILNTIIKV